MKPSNKRLIGILLFVTILLAIPLIAMQFSNEVNWTLSDFVVAATLLFGAGLLLELVLRHLKKPKNRILLVAIIIVLLLIIWIELAVGIFGTPLAGS
ncbi:hypothetical protein ACFQ0I_13850 [Mariniflexile aquimaris]|uniref:Uncharacterized protein n=1 Tax=Mariniflexile aquimaris TaxID=881009 RepID=A0ABW3BXL1_9FLAO